MKCKIKWAAVGAIHTVFQTIGGVLTLDAIMSGVSWQIVGRAALAGALAGAISFTKSLCVGIPEATDDDTD